MTGSKRRQPIKGGRHTHDISATLPTLISGLTNRVTDWLCRSRRQRRFNSGEYGIWKPGVMLGPFYDDKGSTQLYLWVLQAQVKVKSIDAELAPRAYGHNGGPRGAILCRRRTQFCASSWGQGEKDGQVSVSRLISTILLRALFGGMVYGPLAIVMLQVRDHFFYVQGTRSCHSSSISGASKSCYLVDTASSNALYQRTGA